MDFIVRKKKQPIGTILQDKNGLTFILKFDEMDTKAKDNILHNINNLSLEYEKNDLGLIVKTEKLSKKEIGSWFGQRTNISKKDVENNLDFDKILTDALNFSFQLNQRREDIYKALSSYATYNTICDEIDRSIDLLTNLTINKEYFLKEKAPIASFMPLNQLLYSFVCFALVPSYICKKVYVRYPNDSQDVFKELDKLLNLSSMPNIEIFYGGREDFLNITRNEIKAFIFTGTYENMKKVKRSYNKELYCFFGGAGQNPVIINLRSNIKEAVEACIELGTYNQGQDCAAPNALLVKRDCLTDFQEILINKLKEIHENCNSNPEKSTIIMPNTKDGYALNAAKLIYNNRKNIYYGGLIDASKNMIYPTVIVKDLSEGANYEELFCPIFFIQPYDSENELINYFKNTKYKESAMFLTVYGKLKEETIAILYDEKIHMPDSILVNDHLHNFEHGYKPYGGIGKHASGIYYKGIFTPQPILPQREIVRYL